MVYFLSILLNDYRLDKVYFMISLKKSEFPLLGSTIEPRYFSLLGLYYFFY